MHTPYYQPESWDDDPWDVFLADDDEREPEPEPGDFSPDDTEGLPFSGFQSSDLLTARLGQRSPCCH